MKEPHNHNKRREPDAPARQEAHIIKIVEAACQRADEVPHDHEEAEEADGEDAGRRGDYGLLLGGVLLEEVVVVVPEVVLKARPAAARPQHPLTPPLGKRLIQLIRCLIIKSRPAPPSRRPLLLIMH